MADGGGTAEPTRKKKTTHPKLLLLLDRFLPRIGRGAHKFFVQDSTVDEAQKKVLQKIYASIIRLYIAESSPNCPDEELLRIAKKHASTTNASLRAEAELQARRKYTDG